MYNATHTVIDFVKENISPTTLEQHRQQQQFCRGYERSENWEPWDGRNSRKCGKVVYRRAGGCTTYTLKIYRDGKFGDYTQY